MHVTQCLVEFMMAASTGILGLESIAMRNHALVLWRQFMSKVVRCDR